MTAITALPRIQRLDITRVVVPLDESSRAEAAVPVALSLASALGASVELVGVAGTGVKDLGEHPHLGDLAAHWGTGHQIRLAASPAEALVALAHERGTLLCMGSHGRGSWSGALLGSVTAEVLAAARVPILVVGPCVDPDRSVAGGPVVACLDGSVAGEKILPVAASFAWALHVSLALVTVAEPQLPGLDGHLPRRLFGPAEDPGRYVEDLVAEWRPLVPEVEGEALYDPLGPSQGLRHHLQTAPAGMLVVHTRAREGWSRLFHGSVGVDLVRASPVSVLLVPRSRPTGVAS